MIIKLTIMNNTTKNLKWDNSKWSKKILSITTLNKKNPAFNNKSKYKW